MSNFFALLFRMKYIPRWGLMRCSAEENVAEHTTETAILAHALCVIENEMFGGKLDPEKAAVIALYHETAEVITGDLPTPVKYWDEQITSAYKRIEHDAELKIIASLPKEIQAEFKQYITPDVSDEAKLAKAADRLAALIKCTEELSRGNREFSDAFAATKANLESSPFKSVGYFIDECLPAFGKTLDELCKN